MALPKLYSVANVPGLYRTTTRHTSSSIYYGRVQIVDPQERDLKKKKRSRSRRLGVFPATEPAADALRGFRREIRASVGRAAAPQPSAVKTLVDAQRAQLIERAPRLRPATIKNYRREDQQAVRFFGYRWTLASNEPETDEEKATRDCLLSDITRSRIEEWIRFRLDTCSAATMNRELARLRMVMRWAEREGWIEGANPINRVAQLRELEGVIRWLEDDEEKRLKAASPDWLWRMIEFSFWTGLRRGEQLDLRWDQLRNGQIEVRATQSKTLRPRWIPIAETVAQILDEQRADPNAHPVWVFPNRSGKNKWNPFNLHKRWDKARTKAGLADYRWHDNRHTFCSRLVQEGIPIEQIQVLAGHRDIKMTQRYAHLNPRHLRGPIEALEARKIRQLQEIATSTPHADTKGATQKEQP